MAVKGPRVYPMKVVPVRRHAGWSTLVLVLASLLAVGAGAWWAGRYTLMQALGGGVDLAGRMQELSTDNEALREQLAVYRVGGDVTRQVEEKVRTDNRALQDRVAELEQAVADYRKAVVPDVDGKGLRIERLEFSPGNEAGLWHWKLMLLRTGETDGDVQGHLEGRVTYDGTGGAMVASIIPEGAQPFSVRYARQFQGDFRLPAGAQVQRASIAAVISAPRADRVERSWGRAPSSPRKQEVPANAGQG